MIIQKSKKSEDINEMAYSIAKEMTREPGPSKGPAKEKNSAPGRSAGLKGGKAKVQRLSQEERKELARKSELKKWLRS